jgi:hypothetical protein
MCTVRVDMTTTDAVPALRRAFATLARVPASDIASARRDDVANTDFSAASLEDEADLFAPTIVEIGATPRELDRLAERVPDDAVRAVLRRWSTPAGFGVAYGPVDATRVQRSSEHPRRGEHVPPPGAPDPLVEPGWARDEAFRTPAPVAVDAFTMPNGLRVAVVRRPSSGTAWIRVHFDDDADVPGRAERRALYAAAEARTIALDLDDQTSGHAQTSNFEAMVRLARDAWRGHDPAQGWIAVTGDVDSDTVYASVARAFGTWRARTPSSSPSPAPSSTARARRLPSRPLHISLGPALPRARAAFFTAAPKRDDPDWAAMTLLNGILGANGRFDTRLVRELRVRRGLVYGTASAYNAAEGRLGIAFDASHANFGAARASALDVIERLSRGPIAAAELDRARRALLARALERLASPDGVLDMLGDALDAHRAPEDFTALASAYGAVTVSDVERVAHERLNADGFSEIDQGVGPVRASDGR